jgi:hypothetical protein
MRHCGQTPSGASPVSAAPQSGHWGLAVCIEFNRSEAPIDAGSIQPENRNWMGNAPASGAVFRALAELGTPLAGDVVAGTNLFFTRSSCT